MVNRVHIREHIPSDLDAYIDWQTDPDVARYIPWLPRNRADADACTRTAKNVARFAYAKRASLYAARDA